MIVKIWKELFLLILLFASIWLGISYFSFDLDKDPFSISLEREKDFEEYMDAFILGEYERLENPKIDSVIAIIFDRLKSNMDTVSYEYKIHIIKSDQVNAFTSLNGNIYIFSGLIKNLDSPEELALILAHEIGHAEGKHVVEKLIRTLGIEALASILSGGDPLLVSELAKMTISTSFDRANEEEADDFALDLAMKSDINPRRLGQFFIKIKANESGILDELEFIRTHPIDKDRIKKSADFKLEENFKELEFNIDWVKIKESL